MNNWSVILIIMNIHILYLCVESFFYSEYRLRHCLILCIFFFVFSIICCISNFLFVDLQSACD
jgi:hypothetical protein